MTPFSNLRYIFLFNCGNAGFEEKMTITNLASLLVLVFEVLNFDQ